MADLSGTNQSAIGAEFFAGLVMSSASLQQQNSVGNFSCGSINASEWMTMDGSFYDSANDSWLPCYPWNETSYPTDQPNSGQSTFMPSAVFQAVIYSMYSVIFVLALVGNLVVCAVVFTSIRKWTVTNFFIVNMAAGDILMAFFCIPFTFVPTFLLLYWPFGAAMCRIVSFSQAVSVFVSAYTMVAISSDRYLAIVYPLRPRMTRKQAKWIIVIVWMAAVSSAMPILLLSQLVIPENSEWHSSAPDRYICTEVWANPDQQTQYTTVLLLLQYCFPLAVLVFTYGRIGIEIWGKKTPGEAHQYRDLRLARSKRKMIKMMIIVVFFFAFCWLPFNLLQIIGDQYPDIWRWGKINYVVFACHWLAMSHSAYNPIIYCCFNSKFRQGFHALVVRCGCRCLMPASGDRWTGECDCGGHLSGTQGSVHGDHGCAPLQRVSTYTTCTGGSSLIAQRNKNSTCRVLMSTNQCHGIHSPPHSQLHNHLQQQQQQQLIRNNTGYTSRLQQQYPLYHPHLHQQPDVVGQHRARCCSSCNGNASTPRRYSPSSPIPISGCGASVNCNRSRPQKFVFRANFSTPSSCRQQQQQLLSGGAGSPTSTQSAGNTTAESHI